MKICPVCNRVYNDQTLYFCEEDGTTLVLHNTNVGAPATLGIPPAAQTNFPKLPQPKPPRNQLADTMPGFLTQTPPKKSKALFWVLGIFAVVAVVGVVGVVVIAALVGIAAGVDGNTKTNIGLSTNKSPITSISPGSKNVYKNDFSRWTEINNSDLQAKIIGDEYQMASKRENYSYTILASTKFDDNFLTNDTTVRINVRAVSGVSSPAGYGLVINSDIEPLKSDYIFAINNNAANPSYRIARRADKKETAIKEWTTASQIRTGTQTNQLEVRSSGKKLEFYINGQLMTSVTDQSGQDKGIVGVFNGGTQLAGYSNLEIAKN